MGINKKIDDYIEEVCGYVKNRKVHEEIKTELLTHIDEIICEYEASEYSEEESIDKALKHMGNPKEIGLGLNKAHKTKPDWILLGITAVLINIGLIAMYFIQKYQQHINTTGDYLGKSIIYTIVGLSILIGLYFLDYRSIRKYSIQIYIGTIIFFIMCFFWSSPFINGGRLWIGFGGITINYVQVALFTFIVSIAGIFHNYNWSGARNLIKGIVIGLFPTILFILVPSMVMAVTYMVAAFTIIILSGIKKIHFFGLVGSFSIVSLVYIFNEPYRVSRLLSFLNFKEDPFGSGWIYNQLSNIREATGVIGNGINAEMVNIPEIHTEFIFNYILYTFGWVVIALLISIIMVFLIRMIGVAKGTKDNYGKLLISGFVAMFMVEFLWNILMNLGLAPVMGVAMPFLSYGGSQAVINMAVVGLVINVYKFKNVSFRNTTM